MGLLITKKTVSGGAPIFPTVIEVAQGGFKLDNSVLTAGVEVPAGSVMGFNEETRVANVLKVAEVYENADNVATVYKIKKGHLFVGGEKIAVAVGGKSYAATLDTSNADYDTFTVGTTLGVAITAGEVLFESPAVGATAGALMYTPKGLLYESVTAGDNESCSVLLRGTVFEKRIPLVPTAVKSAVPNIIFSQSY
ncbi:MAG: hypothetical protein CVU09_00225 [Bacteroidetes bacterium HGW-Bacteroidetes-4]|jgi:hypothetical protein|nr:MAG: hypothetical protein CVU09_00225 [Bacteroidetes bacterium HGW-Bacteroidetes-4]